jgi:Fur family transcriptional regulator, ferric uptake regulator
VNDNLNVAVEDRLRTIGQRYTPKRRALVEALVGARNPVAVPQLSQRRGLPQSSLYRNLAVLEQAGAVHRVVTHEEFARFELAEDLTHHHHHLVCRSCGMVEDVAVPASLERQVQRNLADVESRTGFSAVSHRLDLIGICRNCA